MMRFGHHDSPVLLEVLGDLFARTLENRLAARCYLKASYEVEDPAAKAAYRVKARGALSLQLEPTIVGDHTVNRLTLDELEANFEMELADAETWYEGLRRDELGWIQGGFDVEAEFARKYYEEPEVVSPTDWLEVARDHRVLFFVVFLAALIGTFLLREPMGGRRILSAVVVAVGVVVLQLTQIQ